MNRHASAVWHGGISDGHGHITVQSGALNDQPYSFKSRFQDESGRLGTNPEELIAAAHASCFTMALSFGLARAGFSDGTLTTRAAVKLDKDGDGFKVSRSDLTLEAHVPGIDEARFAEIAADAKANCPISKLLNAEITLQHTLTT